MMAILGDLMANYTLRVVVLGSLILGLVSGALGTFAVLRKESLLGDAISHAALPGIAIAFLLFKTKHTLVLVLGATVAGWLGTILLLVVIYNTTLKRDAILGIVLSVFFGFGLVLLSVIQRLPIENKAGLTTYLFGNASTLLGSDVWVMTCLGVLVLIILYYFWKEFKVMTFDRDFSLAMGLPIKRLDVLLTTLIVIAIVIGLQMVGVVLMSAMLIAPAAAARQWTDRLSVMVSLSGLIGAFSGMIGAVTSSFVSKLPTGPTIVLVVSLVAFLSLLFSPNRGLVAAWFRHQRNRQKIAGESMLLNMLLFSESMTDPFYAHDIGALHAVGLSGGEKTMKQLELDGFVYSPRDNVWGFTELGYKQALMLKDSRGTV